MEMVMGRVGEAERVKQPRKKSGSEGAGEAQHQDSGNTFFIPVLLCEIRNG